MNTSISKCILACLLLTFSCFFSTAQTIAIGTNNVTYLCSENTCSYITTSNKNMAVTEAIKQYAAGKFVPTHTPVFNGGIPTQYYWFHFSITNQDTQYNHLNIEIQNSRINELELFETSGDSVTSLGKNGDFFLFNKRPVYNKHFVYETQLKQNQKKDYYLFVNQVGHTFILPIQVQKEKQFQQTATTNSFLDGITYGTLFFVALLSFLFFLSTHHTLYVYYSLYIISTIFWLFSYYGLSFQYLWPQHPLFNTPSAPFFACTNIILNIQLCQMLLSTKSNDYNVYRVGNMLKIMLAAIGIFPVFINLNNHGYTTNHTYLLFLLLTIIAGLIIVFITIITHSFKGLMTARFYLAASILKGLSVFNIPFLELGLSPAFYQMEGMLQISILVEAILLAFALARRYHFFKVKADTQRVSAQEEERDKISVEIHDGITNNLAAANMQLYLLMSQQQQTDDLSALKNIYNDINNVQAEARSISHKLIPAYIRNHTINDAIKIYIDRLKFANEQNNFLKINFTPSAEDIKLPDDLKLNIFRIVQELTGNIIKHSGATEALINIEHQKKILKICVEDNGVGFPKNALKLAGIGIENVKMRIKEYQGHLSIGNTQKNNVQYTSIVVEIPFNNHFFVVKGGGDY